MKLNFILLIVTLLLVIGIHNTALYKVRLAKSKSLNPNGNSIKTAINSTSDDIESDPDYSEYMNFLKEHKKGKDKDTKKMQEKFAKFKQVKEVITKHNDKKDKKFKLALNKFSDMTSSELNAFLAYKKLDKNSLPANSKTHSSFSQSKKGKNKRMEKATGTLAPIDWRNGTNILAHGIQDQETCGSCWAHAGELLLSAYDKKVNNRTAPVVYSQQQFIDCFHTYFNNQGNNCEGGNYWWVAYYSYQNQLLQTKEAYPYINADGTCKLPLNVTGTVVTINDFAYYDNVTQDDFYQLLQNGPIAVAVDASPDEFMYYSSGIVGPYNCTSSGPNHAVAIVGYGVENSQEYWIIQNSWGTGWGENGYMRILKDASWDACYLYTDVLDIWV